MFHSSASEVFSCRKLNPRKKKTLLRMERVWIPSSISICSRGVMVPKERRDEDKRFQKDRGIRVCEDRLETLDLNPTALPLKAPSYGEF